MSNLRNSGNNDITTFSKAISLHWEIYDDEGNHISTFNQNADSIDDDMIHLFDGFYSVTGEKILSLEPIEIDFANAKEVSLGVQ